MATLKRYGLYGVMEAELLLRCGQVNLKVHFCGGRINELGSSPAEYYSSNPLEQAMIESSQEFRTGQIKLMGVGECADSPYHPKVMRPTVKPKPAETKPAETTIDEEHSAAQAAIKETELVVEPLAAIANEDSFPVEEQASEEDEPLEDEAPEEEPEAEEPKLEGTAVEVSCVQDAASYLNDHFGIPKSQLKSKAKILEAAQIHGVTFVGL